MPHTPLAGSLSHRCVRPQPRQLLPRVPAPEAPSTRSIRASTSSAVCVAPMPRPCLDVGVEIARRPCPVPADALFLPDRDATFVPTSGAAVDARIVHGAAVVALLTGPPLPLRRGRWRGSPWTSLRPVPMGLPTDLADLGGGTPSPAAPGRAHERRQEVAAAESVVLQAAPSSCRRRRWGTDPFDPAAAPLLDEPNHAAAEVVGHESHDSESACSCRCGSRATAGSTPGSAWPCPWSPAHRSSAPALAAAAADYAQTAVHRQLPFASGRSATPSRPSTSRRRSVLGGAAQRRLVQSRRRRLPAPPTCSTPMAGSPARRRWSSSAARPEPDPTASPPVRREEPPVAPTFHLYLPQMRLAVDAIAERAVAAEAAGFEGIAFMDHLAPAPRPRPAHVGRHGGGDLALARTSTLQVGHLVLCDAFRHPAVLA